jgi:hypothetical protein
VAVGPIAGDVDVATAAANWAGAFDHIRAELHEEFDDRFPRETVDRCFNAEVAKFSDARITAYLPILILRNARSRLRAIEARPLTLQN